jgi:MFS family permease
MRCTPKHPAAKLIQFTYQLAFGGAFHYIPYYYKHYRHYTSSQIGVLQAISFLVSFPACILTARIADAWKLRRRVLVVEAVLTSLLIATLAWDFNIYWTGVVVTTIFIVTNLNIQYYSRSYQAESHKHL